jgi:hypothetical protein
LFQASIFLPLSVMTLFLKTLIGFRAELWENHEKFLK